MMKIDTKLINKNFVKGRKGQKIKYIVIHDTWNFGTSATAMNHYIYFNGAYRGASAHYFVDQKQILQIVKDEDTSWAVGDGNGKYGITNSNSVSIEICVNDGNYEMEINRTLWLTKHLMKKYNVSIDNVVRHYDASRKMCPSIMVANNWQGWKVFKSRLEALDKVEEVVPVAKEVVRINYNGIIKELDGNFVDDKNYVGVRELAETLGFTVTWDNNTKTVIIK